MCCDTPTVCDYASRRSQCIIKLYNSNHVGEKGTVVGGHEWGGEGWGQSWLQPLPLLCLSYYRNLVSRKPGRRECFQLGECQKLTRPTRYLCPQEKAGDPGHLLQPLPFVYLSPQPTRMSGENDMKSIRKMGAKIKGCKFCKM